MGVEKINVVFFQENYDRQSFHFNKELYLLLF